MGTSLGSMEPSEAHNRSLHCTQGGTDEVMVDSEGLRRSQPGVGKGDIIPDIFRTQRSLRQSLCPPLPHKQAMESEQLQMKEEQ